MKDPTGKTPRLGATGEFPQGKLVPEDEGELQLAIAEVEGRVVINFGKPISWIGMRPEEARMLANMLLLKASAAEEYQPDPSAGEAS